MINQKLIEEALTIEFPRVKAKIVEGKSKELVLLTSIRKPIDDKSYFEKAVIEPVMFDSSSLESQERLLTHILTRFNKSVYFCIMKAVYNPAFDKMKLYKETKTPMLHE